MTRRTRGPDSLLPPSLPPIGISRVQAAEFIGVSPSYFDQMVASGAMPPPRRAGSRTIWDVDELARAFRKLPQDAPPGKAPPAVRTWLEPHDPADFSRLPQIVLAPCPGSDDA